MNVFTMSSERRHAALREILAGRMGVEPAAVEVSYEGNGKPYVAGGPPFNLAHSGGLALIAVGDEAAVGVDVERIRRDRPVGRLAERFFSPRERRALESLAGDELVDAFHWCWTAKEAYVKALGVGLRKPLDSFDVSVGLIEPPALLADRQGAPTRLWTLRRLTVPDGYAATLAVAAPGCEVRLRSWAPGGGALSERMGAISPPRRTPSLQRRTSTPAA